MILESPICCCLNGLRGGSRILLWVGQVQKETTAWYAKYTQLMKCMNLSRGSGGMLPQEILKI